MCSKKVSINLSVKAGFTSQKYHLSSKYVTIIEITYHIRRFSSPCRQRQGGHHQFRIRAPSTQGCPSLLWSSLWRRDLQYPSLRTRQQVFSRGVYLRAVPYSLFQDCTGAFFHKHIHLHFSVYGGTGISQLYQILFLPWRISTQQVIILYHNYSLSGREKGTKIREFNS